MRIAVDSENNECPQGHYDLSFLFVFLLGGSPLALKTTNARKGITTLFAI
jgi:hypothetical protein